MMAAPDESFANVLRDQIDMCKVASLQMPKNDQVRWCHRCIWWDMRAPHILPECGLIDTRPTVQIWAAWGFTLMQMSFMEQELSEKQVIPDHVLCFFLHDWWSLYALFAETVEREPRKVRERHQNQHNFRMSGWESRHTAGVSFPKIWEKLHQNS